MKKVAFLLILFTSSYLFAQHPDLTSQRWFVQNITINGTTTEFPQDPVNFPYVEMNFVSSSNAVNSSNLVTDNNCQIGFTGNVTYTSTDVFNFNNFITFSTTTTCDSSESDFMNSYINFFNDEISEDFTYSFQNINGHFKKLILFNNNGDQIEYLNNLSTDYNYLAGYELIGLVINGITYDNPNLFSTGRIGGNTDFSLNYCADLSSLFYSEDTSFETLYLYDFQNTMVSCSNTEDQNFQELFFGFFINNGTNPFTLVHDFDFDFEFDDYSYNVVITNVFGDTAYFVLYTVSTQDHANSLFNIYPNPVKENLIIEEKTNLNIESILGFKTLTQQTLISN